MARGNRRGKEEKEYSFENDVEIDPFNLDAEVLSYPRLVGQYAALAAEANKAAKLAEEKVKTLRSELVKEANTVDNILGKGVKPTVQTIEAYYRTDEDYKEAKQAMIEAQFEADIMNGCVSAINSKRYMLSESLRLISMEYFSTPNMPHNVQDVVKKLEENRRGDVFNRIHQALNKSE